MCRPQRVSLRPQPLDLGLLLESALCSSRANLLSAKSEVRFMRTFVIEPLCQASILPSQLFRDFVRS